MTDTNNKAMFSFDGVHCMVCGGKLGKDEGLICSDCESSNPGESPRKTKTFFDLFDGTGVQIPDPNPKDFAANLTEWDGVDEYPPDPEILPEMLSTVGEMKDGDVAYTVPWAFYLGGQGELRILNSMLILWEPSGIYTIEIRRSGDIILAERTGVVKPDPTSGRYSEYESLPAILADLKNK